jgi:hypothetical protein
MGSLALQTEVETYKGKFSELAGQEGKYALIHGSDLLGVFDTYNDALRAGYEKVGLEKFLVKQISAIESISFFSRDIS